MSALLADKACVECGRQTSGRRCSECAERLAQELDRRREQPSRHCLFGDHHLCIGCSGCRCHEKGAAA